MYILVLAAALCGGEAISPSYGDLLDDIAIERGPVRLTHPVKDAATHDMLRGVLEEPDPVDRALALRGIGQIADPADHERILARCRDTSPRIQGDAWRIAARLNLAVPIDRIREAAADPSPEVRTALYTAWPGLSAESDPDQLSTGMNDEDTGVRLAALQCAAALLEDVQPVVDLLHREEDRLVRSGLYDALLAGDKADRTALIDWGIAAEDPLLRAAAIRACEPGSGVTEQQVIDQFDSVYPLIREAAIDAAARLEYKGALKQALSLLPDADSSLRVGICREAGLLEGTNVVETLLAVTLEDQDHRVRTAVCDSLFKIHSPAALDALTSLVDHENTRLRVAAIERMGQWGDTSVAERLFHVLSEDDAAVVGPTVTALLLLDNKGLADYGDRLMVLSSRKGSGDGNMAAEAIRALGAIDRRDVTPYLHEILRTIHWNDPYMKRFAALEVLQQFDNAQMLKRSFDLVSKRVVPPPPGVPAGPMYDHALVRTEALRYIARYAEPVQAVSVYDMLDDIAPEETRLMLMRFMKHLTGEDYELVPYHRYMNYLVESTAPNPFPSTNPPGIRKMSAGDSPPTPAP